MKPVILGVLLLTLIACGEAPTKPDPIAAKVVTKVVHTECPEPQLREPPAGLLSVTPLDHPIVLPPGEGDYAVKRVDMEKILTALRLGGERLGQWKAWAIGQ